jgi:hypothetical protein
MGISRSAAASRFTLLYTGVALLLALATTGVAAQTVVRGTVVEDATGEPIATVELRVMDAEGETLGSTLSNNQGAFRIELSEGGLVSLSARRVGYAPIVAEALEVAGGEELELEIRLDPRAIALAPVTVVAQRSFVPSRILEFRERAELSQRLGRGRIFMREDIERLRPTSAQQLLDTALWGIGCRPVILLDGLPVQGRLTAVGPDHIEGIELYRGVNQIPPEYYRYGMCGLALVWSRADPPGARPLTWRRALVAGAVAVLLLILAT